MGVLWTLDGVAVQLCPAIRLAHTQYSLFDPSPHTQYSLFTSGTKSSFNCVHSERKN
ncbi:hypothetical protein M413DRAFT_439475 [Hebeloma cylindrosporum]|uniref:Uncharacterized protein n=1 Tax=Hebeloma cylindrosporum TaxID=76867 RepID=A0A0C2Z3I2_HEBCY|nr:hypothetical protein M413DRAFT_439475 [Hebeloma cylindrosporum h7]